MSSVITFIVAALAAVMLLGQPAGAQTAPAAAPAASEYRLGTGDVVRISVFQNADLSVETRITDAGVISYPLLGAVPLTGLTVAAAERRIADGLRSGNFVRDPQVTLLVTQVRGNLVNVLGQVARPGRYPLEMTALRVTDLLAMAGGVSAGGADVVVLTGTRDGKPYRVEVDVPTLFVQDSGAGNPLVVNGDTIWVDRQPLAYIYGEVQRPGPMRVERGLTLLKALATAGGTTQRGTERGIRIHRKGADDQIQVMEAKMDELIREGDVVFVRESLF